MRRPALAAALLLLAVPCLAAQAPKRRVAVLPFDYTSVRPNVIQIFGSDVDLGESVADLIATGLVRNSPYAVVDRSQIDAAMRNQGMQQTSRSDAATAAKVAKVLGVHAIVIGKISELSHSDKQMDVASGLKIGGVSLGNVGTKTSTATVQIDARIVDATTGEIIAVASGSGSASGSGITAVASSATTGTSQLDLGGSHYAGTSVGKATQAAVDKLVAELTAAANKLASTKVAIQGLVADVDGNELIINVGTDAGVLVGSEYDVVRPGKVVKDPATGFVLRNTTVPVGKLKITQADAASATGTLTGGPAKVGDCVGSCPAGPGG